jgi:hypothetical protein
MTDNFNGDTPHLIRCIEALLNLDAKGALAPHGIGGHARTLLEAAAVRLAPGEPVAEVVAGTENYGAVQFSGPIPPKGTKLYTLPASRHSEEAETA